MVCDYGVKSFVWLLLVEVLVLGLDAEVGVGEGVETEVCGLDVVLLEVVYLRGVG